MEPLIDSAALADYPGVSSSQVSTAAAQVRDICGWHIAPQVTETLTLDTDGSTVLPLPTLKIVEVTAVRDVSRDTPVVLDGWRASSAGMLIRPAGWPAGAATVEVDLTHGYETCPEALHPEIAALAQMARRDRSIGQESLGARSISVRQDLPVSIVLARYQIPPTP